MSCSPRAQCWAPKWGRSTAPEHTASGDGAVRPCVCAEPSSWAASAPSSSCPPVPRRLPPRRRQGWCAGGTSGWTRCGPGWSLRTGTGLSCAATPQPQAGSASPARVPPRGLGPRPARLTLRGQVEADVPIEVHGAVQAAVADLTQAEGAAVVQLLALGVVAYLRGAALGWGGGAGQQDPHPRLSSALLRASLGSGAALRQGTGRAARAGDSHEAAGAASQHGAPSPALCGDPQEIRGRGREAARCLATEAGRGPGDSHLYLVSPSLPRATARCRCPWLGRGRARALPGSRRGCGAAPEPLCVCRISVPTAGRRKQVSAAKQCLQADAFPPIVHPASASAGHSQAFIFKPLASPEGGARRVTPHWGLRLAPHQRPWRCRWLQTRAGGTSPLLAGGGPAAEAGTRQHPGRRGPCLRGGGSAGAPPAAPASCPPSSRRC